MRHLLLCRIFLASDEAFNSIPLLRHVRHQPVTIWALSSLSLFLDTFFYTLTISALPDILQSSMGASESANGIVTTMFGVGSLVGSTASGILSDRLGNRRGLQMAGSLVYTTAGVILYFARRYYQVILFRLADGLASGIACTLLYASLGDVYPADRLAFKVAVVYFCNNAGYTIGPVTGQRLYDIMGVKGPAAVIIALSLLKLVLLAVVTEDSLTIRDMVYTNKVVGKDSETCTSASDSRTDSPPDSAPREPGMSLLRLLLRLPVVVATLSIIASIGIQCTLENLVPLHLVDTLNHTRDNGMTFVILGLVFTLMVPVVGKATDRLIGWRGEPLRYWIILTGAVGSILAVALMAFSGSYAVMMTGYALFALADLFMFVPSQSAYGDFVNDASTNSMARGYSIAVFAWAVGAVALPPIGTALYARLGFIWPAFGISVVVCAISGIACLVFIMRKDSSG
ncbi:hypothetical protein GGF46_003292 [Coemansia sp. RSA 552]|nr:hypothetical protein GGF46_003292 [Coemansia sp. RSA 552]